MTNSDKNIQPKSDVLTAQQALLQYFKDLAAYQESEKEKQNGGAKVLCGVR